MTPRLALPLLLTITLASVTEAAPISFNTALPVAKKEFVTRAQFVLDQSGDDPSAVNRDRTDWSVNAVLGYGATRNLAFFGVLPYVDKSLDVTTAGARQSRSASGLGDMRLFSRYTVFQRDWRARTFRIAPFLGLDFPTGDDDKRDSLGRLPPSVQPGSGSWDPFGGVVFTYQTLAFQLDSQLSYKLNTEANDFTFGNIARLDGSLQYRLWPRELGAGTPGFLYGVLESNFIYQSKNQVNGSRDPNSGGFSLFLMPGVQYVTKRWNFLRVNRELQIRNREIRWPRQRHAKPASPSSRNSVSGTEVLDALRPIVDPPTALFASPAELARAARESQIPEARVSDLLEAVRHWPGRPLEGVQRVDLRAEEMVLELDLSSILKEGGRDPGERRGDRGGAAGRHGSRSVCSPFVQRGRRRRVGLSIRRERILRGRRAECVLVHRRRVRYPDGLTRCNHGERGQRG